MVKVKIFASNDGNVMCDAINGFIEGKEVIDIKYTSLVLNKTVKNGIVTEMQVNDRALVIYKE